MSNYKYIEFRPTETQLFDTEQYVHANIEEPHRDVLLSLFNGYASKRIYKRLDEAEAKVYEQNREIDHLHKEIKNLKQALSDEVGTRCNLERRLMDMKSVVAETLAQIGASNDNK